ncbi:Kinesin-like protein kif19 [Polyrhizophydium stewartii]|uniref:Kinesin-like protein kif19 n=1 Tax=Polyrhizophydium stewartii TaxID=2732419 RepID=A0ABR4N4P2_9FUNG
MQTLDDRIKDAHQSIPNTVDKRSRQLLQQQTKMHYLEMDNLDLDLNYTLASAALKQRAGEMQHLAALLEQYEAISSLQRSLLQEKKIEEPSKLQSLYSALDLFKAAWTRLQLQQYLKKHST